MSPAKAMVGKAMIVAAMANTVFFILESFFLLSSRLIKTAFVLTNRERRIHVEFILGWAYEVMKLLLANSKLTIK
ncbi:hypothetical protein VIBNISOn1_1650017 [Vibrio nigripulchritudo SOn1]|uniref:Uncharacterized protein n=1 Tax=Vibrio nigripulchritudo SOn1 TaxID=1238450 RepID=A0AAV2VNB4_9VIBR|nr:hypothetical protein VIBNISOn1_1650017 [Vibrio nigripulchritudo SOn1]